MDVDTIHATVAMFISGEELSRYLPILSLVVFVCLVSLLTGNERINTGSKFTAVKSFPVMLNAALSIHPLKHLMYKRNLTVTLNDDAASSNL